MLPIKPLVADEIPDGIGKEVPRAATRGDDLAYAGSRHVQLRDVMPVDQTRWLQGHVLGRLGPASVDKLGQLRRDVAIRTGATHYDQVGEAEDFRGAVPRGEFLLRSTYDVLPTPTNLHKCGILKTQDARGVEDQEIL